jgi:hypothetical protein
VNLYRDTGRLADAEKACSEALTIYRDLAVTNRARYASMVESLTKLLAQLHTAPFAKR